MKYKTYFFQKILTLILSLCFSRSSAKWRLGNREEVRSYNIYAVASNYMKKRKLLITNTALLGTAAIALTACNSAPGEQLTKAYSNLETVKSFEATTKLSFKDIKIDAAESDPEMQQVVDVLKNSSLTMDTKYDQKTKKQEVVLNIKAKMGMMALDAKVPMLFDEKANTFYIEADSLVDNISPFLQGSGIDISKFKGKTISIDLNELAKDDPELQKELDAMKNSQDTAQLQENMRKELEKLLKDKSEDDFKEEDGKITVNFSDKEVKGLIDNYLKEADLTAEEREEFDKALNDSNAKFSGLTLTSEVDGDQLVSDSGKFSMTAEPEGDKVSMDFTFSSKYNDNLPKSSNVKVNMNVESEDGGGTFAIDTKTNYKSVNKDVKFTVDTKKENLITTDELEQYFMPATPEVPATGEETPATPEAPATGEETPATSAQ